MVIRPLSLGEAEYLGHELAMRLMTYDEPIPPFTTRYPGRLEACLSLPFQTYGGRPMYYRLVNKAAVLFYGVIKDHPFLNGNKRMAVMLTLSFFYINGKWIQMRPDDLYEIACEVAASKPSERDVMIGALRMLLTKTIAPQ